MGVQGVGAYDPEEAGYTALLLLWECSPYYPDAEREFRQRLYPCPDMMPCLNMTGHIHMLKEIPVSTFLLSMFPEYLTGM